jgi:2-oxoacid:acceptor oxidoreductase delta subunit (pyruvate/2-ketoisovalerate family)
LKYLELNIIYPKLHKYLKYHKNLAIIYFMNIKTTADTSSTIKNPTGGWRTYVPKTDYNACIGCGMCAKVCPEYCIKMVKKNGKNIPVTDYDFCKGCGICAAECPVKAIKMEIDKK